MTFQKVSLDLNSQKKYLLQGMHVREMIEKRT